jgi:hypothetical protein
MRSTMFETLSLKEISRLLTIVASTASIAWAGQIAHTSETVTTEEVVRATERVLQEPEPVKTAARKASGLVVFAESELKKTSELHHALVERAELLPVGPEPSDERIRVSLDEMDRSLILAKHALSKLKASTRDRRTFNEENLKSQLFRLQDSVRETQGLFIARENSQSFSVSRTGQ